MTEVGDQYTGFEMHLDFGRAAECEIFILRRRFMLVYVTNSTLHRMQIPASISLAYNCLFRIHAIQLIFSRYVIISSLKVQGRNLLYILYQCVFRLIPSDKSVKTNMVIIVFFLCIIFLIGSVIDFATPSTIRQQIYYASNQLLSNSDFPNQSDKNSQFQSPL